jgi:hypothetical protein
MIDRDFRVTSNVVLPFASLHRVVSDPLTAML